ncbi:unnamed protein product, partial [Rotaria sp. Silwood2]
MDSAGSQAPKWIPMDSAGSQDPKWIPMNVNGYEEYYGSKLITGKLILIPVDTEMYFRSN